MKKILILYPHFPPSNLAGVHRPRLFAQHLPSFGWEPVILTVHEDYYEEIPDWDLHKLLPADLRIEKVKAMKITSPRLIGDIGIRAFFHLYKRAKQLIKSEKFDFLYIPIPSFYCALLGRWLHKTTRIPYGIDYIDPWVHRFPGSENRFSRHWFSTRLAEFLEPIALKKASLITGVAEGYYSELLKRMPELKSRAINGAMPYGGEKADHELLHELNLKPYLFSKHQEKIQFVYAGAMLPKAYKPLERIFKSIAANQDLFRNAEFHFIGTGKTPDDPFGYNIKPLAEQYKLWGTIVFEYPRRIPYLDVLIHLQHADAVFILGSTEPHYTPSKSYQGVLSKKPIMAVLHEESTAADILFKTRAGKVLTFCGEEGLTMIEDNFSNFYKGFLEFLHSFDPDNVDSFLFNEYSAKAVTQKLANLLDLALANS